MGVTRARGWLGDLRVYAQPPVARMLLLGFSAGLPLLLVLGTLSYRLREAGIDRTTIGFLSWVALAYAFKWAWAPLVDAPTVACTVRRRWTTKYAQLPAYPRDSTSPTARTASGDSGPA